MGTCQSRPIKVAPTAPNASRPLSISRNEQDSLENASSGCKSSTSSNTQRGISRPGSRMRPVSHISRKSGRIGGGMYQGMGRVGGRPDSHHSINVSGRGEKFRESFNRKRLESFTAADLSHSHDSVTRQISFPEPNPCETSSSEEFNVAVLRLGLPDQEVSALSAIKCPSCLSQYGKIVHIPYLLLCGHTYCSSCVNFALKNDPSFLKCGICAINSPIQPQSESKDLVQNEPILELTESKELVSILNNTLLDRCAECDKAIATAYCSECSASYCEECNKQQHTGSRVRSRHKPVPINLKPRPQPTCKKHPGQSCVLYCETERQPMCVLCKFYGHHKFHNYQLLNNSANAYRASLVKKLSQVEKLEASLSQAAKRLTDMGYDVKNKAITAQDKLEHNFEETKDELIAALEQREAMLLLLLDRQVQRREDIIQDEREEVAFARARAIAAIEEARRLLDLNPVQTLLARKHIDSVMDTALKQTASFSDETSDDEDTDNKGENSGSHLLPVGLRPKQELAAKIQQVLEQHGAILQLPEKPVFSKMKVLRDCIEIHWKLSEENSEVTSDRTLSYSLQCFADVPFKFKKDKFFNLSRRVHNVNLPSGLSPDSGFQDEGSERSSEASENKRTTLPPIPPSIHSSHNVSLVALQAQADVNHSNLKIKTAEAIEDKLEKDCTENEIKLTSITKTSSPNLPSITATPKKLSRLPLKEGLLTQAAKTSGVLLNLPPLLQKKEVTAEHNKSLSNSDMLSTTNLSGEVADTEDTPRPKGLRTNNPTNENDSLSNSTTSFSEVTTTNADNITDLGRYCKGYAFEEIYRGKETSFRYSGLIRGATYYFRLRCHNAAGDGPWSNTHKCSVLTEALYLK